MLTKREMMKPKWLKFKDCDETRAAWEELSDRQPWDDSTWKAVLEKPVFRVLTGYLGTGMSLFALARVFNVPPREVWKEVKAEGISECDYCSSTKLFVVDTFFPFRSFDEDCVVNESDYLRAKRNYNLSAVDDGLPTFEQMFRKFPLKKCSLGFNPWKTGVYRFAPNDLAHFRQLNTLGFSPKRINAFLQK